MARDSSRVAAQVVRPQFSVRFLFMLTALMAAWMAVGRLIFAEQASLIVFSLIGLAIVVAQLLVPGSPRSMSVLATMGVLFFALPLLADNDRARGDFAAVAFILGPVWGYLLGAPLHLALSAMRRLDPQAFVQVGTVRTPAPRRPVRIPSLAEALHTVLQVAFGLLLVVLIVLATLFAAVMGL